MKITRTNLSLAECKIMFSLLNKVDKEKLNTSEFANRINMRRTDPRFYDLLRFLEENKALEYEYPKEKPKIIKLNPKIIKDIIDEQELINELVNDYFGKHCSLFEW